MIFELYLSNIIIYGIIAIALGVLYAFKIIVNDNKEFDFFLPLRGLIKKFDTFCNDGIKMSKPENEKDIMVKVIGFINEFIKFILGFTLVEMVAKKKK